MNDEVFNVFPELKTSRLFLRELIDPDLDHMLELTSFNNRANTKQEVIDLLKSIHMGFRNKEMITWGLYRSNELIGTIGFYRGFANNSGEVGYVLRENFRRKGFISEAMEMVIKFGFKALKLDVITAYTSDDNKASIAVIKKFGFAKTDKFSKEFRRYELKRELN